MLLPTAPGQDQPQGEPRHRAGLAVEPDDQEGADAGGQRGQEPGPVVAQRVEHAEADAAVPDQDQVEERGDRHRLIGIEGGQRQPFGDLVQHQDGQRQQGAGQLAHRAQAARAVATASVQRRHRCSGDAATSGRTCQQRTHFSPSASPGTTATPGTSSSVKAPAGAVAFGERRRRW